MAKALLFDVGDVLMESNWVVIDELERQLEDPPYMWVVDDDSQLGAVRTGPAGGAEQNAEHHRVDERYTRQVDDQRLRLALDRVVQSVAQDRSGVEIGLALELDHRDAVLDGMRLDEKAVSLRRAVGAMHGQGVPAPPRR